MLGYRGAKQTHAAADTEYGWPWYGALEDLALVRTGRPSARDPVPMPRKEAWELARGGRVAARQGREARQLQSDDRERALDRHEPPPIFHPMQPVEIAALGEALGELQQGIFSNDEDGEGWGGCGAAGLVAIEHEGEAVVPDVSPSV